jgi:hypothetical protein
MTVTNRKVDLHGMTVKDYGYCEDCKCVFDLWKYGDAESAGHADCNWRYVTEDELTDCVEECLSPYPRCPECGSATDDFYCEHCKKQFTKYTVEWVNCFTE